MQLGNTTCVGGSIIIVYMCVCVGKDMQLRDVSVLTTSPVRMSYTAHRKRGALEGELAQHTALTQHSAPSTRCVDVPLQQHSTELHSVPPAPPLPHPPLTMPVVN